MRKLEPLGVRVEAEIESNIVIFRLGESAPPLPIVLARLKESGVLMGGMRGGVRAVTHSQVTHPLPCSHPRQALPPNTSPRLLGGTLSAGESQLQ